MIVLFMVYIWMASSGREEWILDQGRAVYQIFSSWFDDAELDFQLKKSQPPKKNRRWD